jgi:hypothetical protein
MARRTATRPTLTVPAAAIEAAETIRAAARQTAADEAARPVVHPCDVGHAAPAPAPETEARDAELFTITAPDVDGLYAALISHIGAYVPASRLILIAQSVVGLYAGRIQNCGYVITWGSAWDTPSQSKRVSVSEMNA